jgi:hypothetical protein
MWAQSGPGIISGHFRLTLLNECVIPKSPRFHQRGEGSGVERFCLIHSHGRISVHSSQTSLAVACYR